MTNDEFRTMALKIPAAVERSHMNHPDFRVAGKIFASLGVPDKKQGYTNVYLPFAKTNIVRAALEAAAKNVASKKKKTPNVEHRTPNAQ